MPNNDMDKFPLQHPKALEAAERVEHQRQDRAVALDTVNSLVKIHSLSFMMFPRSSTQHGLVVAYTIHRKNVMKFSTSLCHPDDRWEPLKGKYMAAMNFNEGHVVKVWVPTGVRHTMFLRRIGMSMLSWASTS